MWYYGIILINDITVPTYLNIIKIVNLFKVNQFCPIHIYVLKIEIVMYCETLSNYKLQLTRHKVELRICIVMILYTIHIRHRYYIGTLFHCV